MLRNSNSKTWLALSTLCQEFGTLPLRQNVLQCLPRNMVTSEFRHFNANSQLTKSAVPLHRARCSSPHSGLFGRAIARKIAKVFNWCIGSATRNSPFHQLTSSPGNPSQPNGEHGNIAFWDPEHLLYTWRSRFASSRCLV